MCVWVYLCLCRFSGEAQQVLTGPPSSLRSPLRNPAFCVYVGDCVCVCVCQPAWSAQRGSDVNVIDSRAVTRAIESSCGKRGTLQPHSFQPWGGEGDKYRQRRKRESKQITRIHTDEVLTNMWAERLHNVQRGFSKGPDGCLNRNWQDKTELTPDKKQPCVFIIKLPIPWSHGLETLGTTEVYGKWLILGEWCHT